MITWPWRFKTVDEIKVWWKLWSIRLGALGTVITSWLVAFPDQALNMWAMMPYEVRQYIPAQYMPMIGIFMFVLSMLSRFIKQKNLRAEIEAKKAEEAKDGKA